MHNLAFRSFKIKWFVVFYLVLTVISVIPVVMGNLSNNTIQYISYATILLTVLYVLWQSKKHQIQFNDTYLKEEMSPKRWTKYILFSLLIKVIAILGVFLLAATFIYIFYENFQEWYSFFMNEETLTLNGWLLVIYGVVICILAPIWEELFFRGILLRKFLLKVSAPWAIILSSIIFGLLHFGGNSMFNAFLFGCFLSYIYLRTKNIFVSMIIHAVSNFTSYIVVVFQSFQEGSVDQGFEIFTKEEIGSFIIYLVIFFLILLGVLFFILHRNWSKIKAIPRIVRTDLIVATREEGSIESEQKENVGISSENEQPESTTSTNEKNE